MKKIPCMLVLVGCLIGISTAYASLPESFPSNNGKTQKLPVKWQAYDNYLSTSATPVESQEQSMIWGWCDEPASYGAFPSGLYCVSAIGVTEPVVNNFAGCYVKSLMINKGYFTESNPVIDIMLFKGNPGYDPEWDSYTLYGEQPFILKKDIPFTGQQGEWVEFELDEPYLIKSDEVFYAGWGYLNIDDNNLPLAGDDVYNENPDSSWMTGYYPENPDNEFWSNCWTAGANCIRLRITGDNLPSDNVALLNLETPRFVVSGESASVTVTVSNKASNVIEELEFSYAVAGSQEKNVKVSGLSIQPGQLEDINIENIELSTAGNLMFEIKAISVNGNTDYDESDNIKNSSILCLPQGIGFNRNVVVEEGTGTWCGNCPRGIVAMHEMTTKYPEKFIGIAAHSDDIMDISGYWPYLERYIDIVGYPYSTVDRVKGVNPHFEILESDFLEEASVPAIARVDIENVTLDNKNVSFNYSVEFAVSENNTEYGWAFVITEDNVGPYLQSNYYTNGSLPGWDYTSDKVLISFDHVAREAQNIMGDPTIPSDTETGVIYSQTAEINAANVTDFNNAQLIAMVINMKTGFIENACRKSLSGDNSIGKLKYDIEEPKFYLADKRITLISGDEVAIYSLSGTTMGILNSGETIEADPGVYLAKSNGKSYKLLVR